MNREYQRERERDKENKRERREKGRSKGRGWVVGIRDYTKPTQGRFIVQLYIRG